MNWLSPGSFQWYLMLWAGAAGYAFGPLIAWAIRSWPGHEALVEEYLHCWKCRGGGKRQCCNAGASQDFWYAVFSALIGVASVAAFGLGTKALLSWVFAVSCLIITVVDIRYLIIPDTLSINGCYAGLLYAGLCHLGWRLGWAPPQHYITFSDSLTGFLIGGGFLWGLGTLAWILLKKEGMGGGDVKLLAAFGAWLGWKPVIGVVVIASLFGSAGGIIGILYNRLKYNQKYRPLTHMIPFGPYLCFGFLLIFYGGMEPLYRLLDIYFQWVESRLHGG